MRLGDSQMHRTKTSCLGQLTKVKPLHMFPIQQKPAILFPQWWTKSLLSLITISLYLRCYANCWERVLSLHLRLIRPPILLQRRRVLPLPLCPREAPLKLKQMTRIESEGASCLCLIMNHLEVATISYMHLTYILHFFYCLFFSFRRKFVIKE